MIFETEGNEVTVWLVKFPVFLSQGILNLQSETEIGTIEVIDKSINLKLSPMLNALPKEYSIKIEDITKHMYVIKSDSWVTKVEGRLVKDCNVIPVINKQYIEFKKNSIKEIKKELQNIELRDVTHDTNEIDNMAKRRKKLLMEKKRERLDKNEVMDIIFRAYETSESFTTKEIADYCGQPIAYMQEILPEISIMNKKDQRNAWFLKDEYKHQKKN
ncbi:General transcription factor IIF subunit 2 [Gurleya vavrai]